MTEIETETITTTASPPPISESENSTTMPTIEKELKEETEKKDLNSGGISLRIWPPTQKTRDAVIKRLIETLSTESIVSKRYGILQSDEASSVAKSIEDEAYGVASAIVNGDDDGIEILKVYSKEISKRMLESMKAKTPIASSSPNSANKTESAVDSNADVAPDESIKMDEV